MLKCTMLAAFAAVSVCAMAQDTWNEGSKYSIDATGKSHYDIKREVCKQTQYLSGGDAYDFEAMLNRMPGNTEDALVSALFCAHRQAVIIRDQMILTMIPTDADTMAFKPDQEVLAQESDNSMRPMRMVMEDKTGYRNIDEFTALDILTTDLTSTQQSYLQNWWDNDANNRDKFIIVELLKVDAQKAKDPIYVSCYTHHTYTWPTQ